VAEETLNILMRARGAREVVRETRRVGRGLRDAGDESKRSAKKVGMFDRALQLLGTRMGMLIILGTVLTFTFGPSLLVAIALLTAASLALGAVIAPVIGLVAGAMLIFKANSDKAGTAAAYLKAQLASTRKAFIRMISPGANILMKALAQSLQILAPLFWQLRGPMTQFAKAMAAVMVSVSKALVVLGPELAGLVTAVIPLLAQMGPAIAPFIGTLIDLATAGIPVLSTMVGWIVKFSEWLRPAIQDAIAFAQSEDGVKVWNATLGAMASAGVYLWGIIKDLASIVLQIADDFSTEGAVGGGAFLWVLNALSDAIDWASKNWGTVSPVIYGLVAAFTAFKIAVALTNAVLLLSPWTWLAIALVGIVAGQKFESVRTAVDLVWTALKALWDLFLVSPLAVAAVDLGHMADNAWKAMGGINGIKDALQSVKDAWDSLPNPVRSGITTGIGAGLKSSVKQMLGPAGDLILGGKAEGGPVQRSGRYMVGEKGPEVVDLQRGNYVHPNGAATPPQNIHVTLVMPDGQVLAKQTVRAARKALSTR
jgi:hypothetical protein